ncbi:ParB-like nuclease domain-containing protein (plasmid) [Acaryochloris sp. 'Moss Beach']|uniref:ParB N-terminal domain-containing protein n=1 Tax=Acaryochloris sp. 'Moss Beach' TaxID=2740837 RepID=UPI00210267F5|nr:ParB N-terminal domain-containing protein [Acaryochloris sp. 'Moss Beach']UJB72676.1 ParB-like nuclease domain-containing protein [Acaryochloris sp. 'Moss Beach']
MAVCCHLPLALNAPPNKPESESIESTIQLVEIAKIRMDGGTQPRSKLYEDVVAEYAEDMKQGATFPPVVIYYDGKDYWLADGFHRVRAKEAIDEKEISAEVFPGELRDAVLHSVGANAAHGLRRTNADKRRAVIRLVRDREWRKWSDREIARRCGVSAKLVGSARKELSAAFPQIENDDQENMNPNTRIAMRGGTVYEIDTTGIRQGTQIEEKKPRRKRTKKKSEIAQPSASQSKDVEKGDIWKLGKSHYLFCGDPSSKRFQKLLPSAVGLFLFFLETRDNWPQAIPENSMNALLFYTSYGEDLHLETLRGITEYCLSGTTDANDPVVMVGLIDPSLFILIDELECPCYCAETDPQRCSDALTAWSITNQISKKVIDLSRKCA